jgi:hypothetical protein
VWVGDTRERERDEAETRARGESARRHGAAVRGGRGRWWSGRKAAQVQVRVQRAVRRRLKLLACLPALASLGGRWEQTQEARCCSVRRRGQQQRRCGSGCGLKMGGGW